MFSVFRRDSNHIWTVVFFLLLFLTDDVCRYTSGVGIFSPVHHHVKSIHLALTVKCSGEKKTPDV